MTRDPDILTAEDAAILLGLDRKGLYAAAARGEVPHRRVGRRFLFSRIALASWLHGTTPDRGSPRREEDEHASVPD